MSNGFKLITTTLRHPKTGHVVVFGNDPREKDSSQGAVSVFDEGTGAGGSCTRFRARDFWKELVTEGYKRAQ